MKTIEQVDAEAFADLRSYLECFSAHVPVRTVTVIGNAPLAPDVNRRDLIDSSDLVFRCNSFVLDEPVDEPCLGTKTDVVIAARVTRVTPWFFDNYPSRAYLVVDVGQLWRKNLRPRPIAWPDDLGEWPISNRLFGIPLRRAYHPERDGRGVVPTTGTEAAYVAHELFPEARLTLTGFSFLQDREQTEWAHHWGSVVPVHKAHRLDEEGALLQSWVDDGSAEFVP